MSQTDEEKQLQEQYGERSHEQFMNYRNALNYYCAKTCVEEAKGPAVLDMACGNGNMLEQFTAHFDRVVAADASGFQLNLARKRNLPVELHESLMEDLDLGEKFDSVFILKALEHVQDPLVALKNGVRHMKDDGVMLVQVPNAEAINRKLALLMGTLTHLEELSPFDIHSAGHRRYYTMDTLKKDVEAAGLEVIKEGGVFFKVLSTPQMDWFLENAPWDKGGYGWGRDGEDLSVDLRAEFCRASYELGKQFPRECNIVWVLCRKKAA
ncbi:MAG: class I SAM-dependent methyltransferase [Deltaproteobacteria bacterium]|nr:class I SAM-dependent methyltransferase [Deltaproteobacteria bacterium]